MGNSPVIRLEGMWLPWMYIICFALLILLFVGLSAWIISKHKARIYVQAIVAVIATYNVGRYIYFRGYAASPPNATADKSPPNKAETPPSTISGEPHPKNGPDLGANLEVRSGETSWDMLVITATGLFGIVWIAVHDSKHGILKLGEGQGGILLSHDVVIQHIVKTSGAPFLIRRMLSKIYIGNYIITDSHTCLEMFLYDFYPVNLIRRRKARATILEYDDRISRKILDAMNTFDADASAFKYRLAGYTRRIDKGNFSRHLRRLMDQQPHSKL